MKQNLTIIFSVFACLALTALLSHAQDNQPIDLILVAGQSNSVGFNAIPADLPADPIDKDILFWWRCGDPPPDKHDTISSRKWTHLQPQPIGNPMPKNQGVSRQYGNFAQKEGGFGPEIGLARTLAAKSGAKLAVVKAAFSGTGIQRDWNPESEDKEGACYRALIEETQSAVAAAKKNGNNLRLKAFVWVQGESDANKNDAPKYAERLAHMIASLREDLDAPELVALVAVNTKFGGGKNAFMPKIIEAQQAVAAKDPRCVYVDTSAATIANKAHYDTQGTLDVGKWFAEALLEWKD